MRCHLSTVPPVNGVLSNSWGPGPYTVHRRDESIFFAWYDHRTLYSHIIFLKKLKRGEISTLRGPIDQPLFDPLPQADNQWLVAQAPTTPSRELRLGLQYPSTDTLPLNCYTISRVLLFAAVCHALKFYVFRDRNHPPAISYITPTQNKLIYYLKKKSWKHGWWMRPCDLHCAGWINVLRNEKKRQPSSSEVVGMFARSCFCLCLCLEPYPQLVLWSVRWWYPLETLWTFASTGQTMSSLKGVKQLGYMRIYLTYIFSFLQDARRGISWRRAHDAQLWWCITSYP